MNIFVVINKQNINLIKSVNVYCRRYPALEKMKLNGEIKAKYEKLPTLK